MKAGLTYAHRLNPDGSFDSICLYCHHTVATANTEQGLASQESSHSDDHFQEQQKNWRDKSK
jgi:hypothetical protein